MATAKRVFNQLEINFWHAAIPLLTDSPELHLLIRGVGSLITKYRAMPLLFRLAWWAAIGWIVGLALGIFSGHLVS